jgi:type VI secretion system secreted protein Hcp
MKLFWEVEGVPGTAGGHGISDAIKLNSYVHRVSRPTGKPPKSPAEGVHGDFIVTKPMDLTSPALNEKCCKGELIGSMKVHALGDEQTENAVPQVLYTFERCYITSVAVDAGAGSNTPVETVAFTYGAITWQCADSGASRKATVTAPQRDLQQV